ncbi:hypothetical protein ACIQMR_35200 [Streptomyces sp. NPDC091376]|uniref:hypothetical protein n=1 Tax=Streptomyces sp. NPDC091376 TaxID=3365994 RepID=UPI00382989D5
MPGTDGYGQNVPRPVLGDAANIETAMAALVNGVVPLTVMRFANANARAAAFDSEFPLVPGMVTYLIAEDRWEARRSDGTWLLLSDGPWQPLSYASGYVANAGAPAWRQKAGGGIELRGRIMKSGGANFTADNQWRVFATLPTVARPAAARYFIAAARHTVDGDNQSHQTARVQVATDGEMSFGVELGGGTGIPGSDPAWFSLDGIQFSPAGD